MLELGGFGGGELDGLVDVHGRGALGADHALQVVAARSRLALPRDPVFKRGAGEQLPQRRDVVEERAAAAQDAQLYPGSLR